MLQLRATLNDNGYNSMQIIAPDAGATQGLTLTLLRDMVTNASFQATVDVIGTHGYWSRPPSDFTTLQKDHGTRAWVSESWHQMGSWYGAMGMATKIMAAHLGGNYTGWTAWGLLFAAYPNVLCQDKGIMYATNPWGGVDASYQIGPTIWTTAHFTQFAPLERVDGSRTNWRFLLQGSGSGTLKGGATYVTLVDDAQHRLGGSSSGRSGGSMVDESDYSIIIDCFTMDSGAANVTFSAGAGGVNKGRLQVWATTEDAQFVRMADAQPSGPSNSFTIELQGQTLYSLTTLPDGAIVKGLHQHSKVDTVFPLPYENDFESTAVGRSPTYFTDWDGSFGVEAESDRGADVPVNHAGGERSVLRQMVLQRPLHWHCTDVDPITIIGEGMQNYAVRATARVESNTSETYSSTFAAVYARVTRPYRGWCPTPSGYRLQISSNGTWSLLAAGSLSAASPASTADPATFRSRNDQTPSPSTAYKTLACGVVPEPAPLDGWRNLSLEVDTNILTAIIDGKVVAKVQDDTFDSGSAGLGSGFHYAAFDAVSVVPLRPTPTEVAMIATRHRQAADVSVPSSSSSPSSSSASSSSASKSSLSPASFAETRAATGDVDGGGSNSSKGSEDGDRGGGGVKGTKAAASTTPTLAAYCGFTNVERSASSPPGWYGMVFTTMRAITVTSAARYAASGNNGTHVVKILAVNNASYSAAPATVATVSISFNDPKRLLDSSGFVHAAFPSPVLLNAGKSYYLLSSEVQGGDSFYQASSTQSCAGHLGPGGTLPRMRVLTDAITVDGGVSSASTASGQAGAYIVAADWEPRSFGPVTFSFTEGS